MTVDVAALNIYYFRSRSILLRTPNILLVSTLRGIASFLLDVDSMRYSWNSDVSTIV